MATWIKPTGGSGTGWSNISNAYDGDTGTRAEADETVGWDDFITLTHLSVSCSSIRFWAERNIYSVEVNIDIYYSGAWHDLYLGDFTNRQWDEKAIGSTEVVTAIRLSFCSGSYLFGGRLHEVEFYGTIVTPTVTAQAVSDILSTTATGNGNITSIGGENATKRGVCWNTTGSPTIADNKEEEGGLFGTGAFTAAMTGLSPGVKYYVKAYAYNSGGYAYSSEVDFTTDKIAPTVTVQSSTDILPTTVTGNGNITALGGENSITRGFGYGLTQMDTWDVHDDGSFGVGAYTKGLTGLSANTTYWIRAYATNSIGTGYSAWLQFQTAASGTIPTGTRINICSDYSGYTHQLMRSETDDGLLYTAYFVISTDLSNKQALAFYKRILDLHLYFKSEASGTATIEVKRDNEASWQAVGSVSLTGTAEIIVKHLATRIYAKHFLFKISAANYFRFLGCLFEFLPGGMR